MVFEFCVYIFTDRVNIIFHETQNFTGEVIKLESSSDQTINKYNTALVSMNRKAFIFTIYIFNMINYFF